MHSILLLFILSSRRPNFYLLSSSKTYFASLHVIVATCSLRNAAVSWSAKALLFAVHCIRCVYTRCLSKCRWVGVLSIWERKKIRWKKPPVRGRRRDFIGAKKPAPFLKWSRDQRLSSKKARLHFWARPRGYSAIIRSCIRLCSCSGSANVYIVVGLILRMIRQEAGRGVTRLFCVHGRGAHNQIGRLTDL